MILLKSKFVMSLFIFCVRFSFLTTLLVLNTKCVAQSSYYKQDLIDGRGYIFTMKQGNDLMQNPIRYINNSIKYNDLVKKDKAIYVFSNLLFSAFLAHPITHELGHQSVWNELKIGSVNRPIIDKKLVIFHKIIRLFLFNRNT